MLYLALVKDCENGVTYAALSADREAAVCQAREKFTGYSQTFFYVGAETPEPEVQVIALDVDCDDVF